MATGVPGAAHHAKAAVHEEHLQNVNSLTNSECAEPCESECNAARQE
jgi:hypothetical protein